MDGKKRVLIAEDEEKLRKLAKFALAQAGVDVDIVSDGAEAVQAVKANNYDLIIMDLMMPNMDGFQALEHIRKLQNTEKTPVLILSARADVQAVARARDLNISGYIKKPYSPAFLVEKVKEFIPA